MQIMRYLYALFVLLSFLMAIKDSPIVSLASLSWGRFPEVFWHLICGACIGSV